MGIKSSELFTEAKKHMPGGVNSPVRAFGSVGGDPVFFVRGQGSKMYDADGKEYIDYVQSWGPLILGHAHPEVIEVLHAAVDCGTSFGTPTPGEIGLALAVKEALPTIEMIRMVNSGTEATMSALRVARGYTQRQLIVKFAGCYHGHADMLLVKAGSGAMTLGTPDSAGVGEGSVRDTIVIEYNDKAALQELFAQRGKDIAAVIIEPVAGNMGVVIPEQGYLELLRELCTKSGTVLIFDEVMTGFRVAHGGAQIKFDIQPDLTTLAKVIGGGLPVGAYGGKKEIMEKVSPLGPVYQAGTLSGNPLAMAAGIKTLEILKRPGVYEDLERKTAKLCDGMQANAQKVGIKMHFSRVGTMFTAFFTDTFVRDYASAKTSDIKKYAVYFHAMLEQGIYLAPSQFETGFMSCAHTDADIDRTLEANYKALVRVLEECGE